MIVSLVVAVAQNGVIGRGGDLPWHIPSELKLFKSLTLGKPVIMGRKTWDGLTRKPLPGRLNIVVTRQERFQAEGSVVVHSLADALVLAKAEGAVEACVIGGGELYKQALEFADRIYRTEVELEVEGDTSFPAIDPAIWHLVQSERFEAGPNDAAAYSARIFERISSER